MTGIVQGKPSLLTQARNEEDRAGTLAYPEWAPKGARFYQTQRIFHIPGDAGINASFLRISLGAGSEGFKESVRKFKSTLTSEPKIVDYSRTSGI